MTESPVCIELNDCEIRVARDGDIVVRSPGFAVVGKNEIEVGEKAVRKAWLNPRAAWNRYWQQLNVDPLPNPTARARHHADLAYAHLLALHEDAGKPDTAVFAVPGHYSNEQLALLLGLVEASPLAAVGLVDTAVAAAAAHAGPGSYVHAELYLHQSVLTRIEVGDEVVRTAVHVVGDPGWVRVLEDCANRVADLFIEQTRFDPQHHAETEQALFDRLPGLLHALAGAPEVAVEIPYGGTVHLAQVPRSAIHAVLRPAFRRLTDELEAVSAGAVVLMGDRLAGLPGLASDMEAVEVLPADGVFTACRAQLERIHTPGEALDFVTRLAARRGGPVAPESAPAPVAGMGSATVPEPKKAASAEAGIPPVTHVLCGHQAVILDGGEVLLDGQECRIAGDAAHAHAALRAEEGGWGVHALNGAELLLNGESVPTPVQVRLGDQLRFSGGAAKYLFINVPR
ncbi:hypothetical protein [Elongatibacter sediminis]|uniref:FHA domain-containing protein n=1 Tax=Elongatibacter sediminis TaxID=3119006 RepID=A0AAW9RFN4_9GAMM